MGATGDLSRRKLLPGMFHLVSAGFIPGCRIVGVSLDDLDADGFRSFVRAALDEFSTRKIAEADWDSFAANLDYVPLAAGGAVLKAAVENAAASLGGESRRLHYLSVPPSAALSAVRMLGEAGLAERDSPAGRAAGMAAAVRADLARSEPLGQLRGSRGGVLT